MKNKIALFSIVILLSGCATTSVYNLPESEQKGLVQEDYNYSQEKVFKACIQDLSSIGWVINNTDEESGLISTEWRQSEGFSYPERAKISLIVSSIDSTKSKVKLNLQYQRQDVMGPGWVQQKITKKMAKKNLTKFFEDISNRLKN